MKLKIVLTITMLAITMTLTACGSVQQNTEVPVATSLKCSPNVTVSCAPGVRISCSTGESLQCAGNLSEGNQTASVSCGGGMTLSCMAGGYTTCNGTYITCSGSQNSTTTTVRTLSTTTTQPLIPLPQPPTTTQPSNPPGNTTTTTQPITTTTTTQPAGDFYTRLPQAIKSKITDYNISSCGSFLRGYWEPNFDGRHNSNLTGTSPFSGSVSTVFDWNSANINLNTNVNTTLQLKNIRNLSFSVSGISPVWNDGRRNSVYGGLCVSAYNIQNLDSDVSGNILLMYPKFNSVKDFLIGLNRLYTEDSTGLFLLGVSALDINLNQGPGAAFFLNKGIHLQRSTVQSLTLKASRLNFEFPVTLHEGSVINNLKLTDWRSSTGMPLSPLKIYLYGNSRISNVQCPATFPACVQQINCTTNNCP